MFVAFSCLCQPVGQGENLEVLLMGNPPRYSDTSGKSGQNEKTIWFYTTQSNSKLERRSMWFFYGK